MKRNTTGRLSDQQGFFANIDSIHESHRGPINNFRVQMAMRVYKDDDTDGNGRLSMDIVMRHAYGDEN